MSIYSDILADSKHSFEDIEAFDTAEEAQDAIEDTLEFDSATDALTESTMQGELLAQKEAAMESLMASVGAINRKGRWNDEATVMFNACVESIYIGTNLPAPVISSFEAEGDAGKAAEEKTDGMWTKIKNTIKEWIRQFKEFVKKWWNIAFDTFTKLERSAKKMKSVVDGSDKNTFGAKFTSLPEIVVEKGLAGAFETIGKSANVKYEYIDSLLEEITANADKPDEHAFTKHKMIPLTMTKFDKPKVLEYSNKGAVQTVISKFADGLTFVSRATRKVSESINGYIKNIDQELKVANTKADVNRLKTRRRNAISAQKRSTALIKNDIADFKVCSGILWKIIKGSESTSTPATESLRWY